MNNFDDLKNKIISREAIICVIGLGYVGLPLINAFVEAGFRVCGYDTDIEKIDQLNASQEILPHLGENFIKILCENKNCSWSSDFLEFQNADIFIICVPTPIDDCNTPILDAIDTTVANLVEHKIQKKLIILESSTYPGCTLERVSKLLGADNFIGFSPEREDPGNPKYNTTSIPKIISADDEYSLQLQRTLYSSIIKELVELSSTKLAEATKLTENIYRSVNIALINELKILFDCLDINTNDVVRAASTKPFGYNAFWPGPGVGGHCIPVDPYYLSWVAKKNKRSTAFIEKAGEVNSHMPTWIVQKVLSTLQLNGKAAPLSFLVIGAAYKPNVIDYRQSPAADIVNLLLPSGKVVVFDPLLVKHEHKIFGVDLIKHLSSNILNSFDAAIIITDHDAIDYKIFHEAQNIVFDTRDSFKSRNIEQPKNFVQV